MMFTSCHSSTRRAAAVMAMFAMLLVALMPTVSRAVAFANGDAALFQELCSGGSVKRMMANAPISDPAHQIAKHMESCGYCIAFGSDAALLPIANSHSTPLLAFVQEMPERFYRATPKLHAWSNTHARGPPR